MLVKVQPGSESGAESRVAAQLEKCNGQWSLPGLAAFNVYVPSRQGPKQVDALIWTPHALVVCEIKGITDPTQTGTLTPPLNGPWMIDGKPAAMHTLNGQNPLEQCRSATFAAKNALEAAGIDTGFVLGMVIVVGDGVHIGDTSAVPRGFEVVSADLKSLRRPLHSDGRSKRWTADMVRESCRALQLDSLSPDITELQRERFPELIVRTPKPPKTATPPPSPPPPPAPDPPPEPPPAHEVPPPHTEATPQPPPSPPTKPRRIPRWRWTRRDRPQPSPFAPYAEPWQPPRRKWARIAKIIGIGLAVVTALWVAFSFVMSLVSMFEPAPDPSRWERGDFTYTQALAPSSSKSCAKHAYGKVRTFLAHTECTSLRRELLKVDDGDALVARATVRMPTAHQARQLKTLVDSSGTGNIRDLARSDSDYMATTFDGRHYASQRSGRTVTISEAASTDSFTSPSEPELDQIAKAGLSYPH